MTIHVGDQTIWLEQNYRGMGRPCLLTKHDNGEIQILATFSPSPSGGGAGLIRLLKNYAFGFANAGGLPILTPLTDEDGRAT